MFLLGIQAKLEHHAIVSRIKFEQWGRSGEGRGGTVAMSRV